MPEPVPGAGEMVLKVGRCGICGSDVHLTNEQGWFPDNCILGHEFAGEVVEVGAGVEGFQVGDVAAAIPRAGCGQCAPCLTGNPYLCPNGRTSYTGGFAEYVKVAARTSIKLPGSLSMGDGALIEPLAVALHGVLLAKSLAGARVLVLGAGSIGVAVIHWTRQLGAGKIVAASRSATRADQAIALGADAFVETGDGVEERVVAALGGAPDVVFECIGVPGAIGLSISLVRTGGTVISLGFCTKPDPVLPAVATYKQVSLLFSMAYSLSEFQMAADFIDRGLIASRAMITSVIPLEQVASTIDRLRTEGSFGEIKIQADPSLSPAVAP